MSEMVQILFVSENSNNVLMASSLTVDCIVPQGSLLGPLKFVGSTEDLAELISHHRLSCHLWC